MFPTSSHFNVCPQLVVLFWEAVGTSGKQGLANGSRSLGHCTADFMYNLDLVLDLLFPCLL